MGYQHTTDLDEENRRTFLKALGVGGAVAAGDATLGEVRDAISTSATGEVTSIGQAVAGDLTAALDGELLAAQQAELATQTSALTGVLDKGLPENGPRTEFQQVAAAGRPVYTHLLNIGFFESTTSHLPAFNAEFIEDSVRTAVTTDVLASVLADTGFDDHERVDLLATVVNHRHRIGEQHWVQTDELPRGKMEIGEQVPSMTQAVTGGTLLWLEDLDQHLWSQQVLLTQDVLADAVWEARAMAAGLQLVAEGAKAIGAEDAALAEDKLTAVLASGFALQAIAQNLLPEDVYWITEEMRAPARTDLEPANVQFWSE